MDECKQYLVPTYGMFFCEPLMKAYDEAEPGTRSGYLKNQPDLTKNLRMCKNAGVMIAAGTDNTYWSVPGLAWEIYCYVTQDIMSPMEAIKAATRTAAKLCNVNVGAIEKGKFADILVVDGDPIKDIGVLQDPKRIDIVYKEGKIVARNGHLTDK
jgi:imidazolonepropionase-like amidohydrolase